MLREAIHGSLLDSLSLFQAEILPGRGLCEDLRQVRLGGLRRIYSSHRCILYSLDEDMPDERPTIFANVELLLGQADP